MVSQDGKMRKTDATDAEQILRLIQSIPSKKAEPFLKVDLVDKETGLSMGTNIELHDKCAEYLR